MKEPLSSLSIHDEFIFQMPPTLMTVATAFKQFGEAIEAVVADTEKFILLPAANGKTINLLKFFTRRRKLTGNAHQRRIAKRQNARTDAWQKGCGLTSAQTDKLTQQLIAAETERVNRLLFGTP